MEGNHTFKEGVIEAVGVVEKETERARAGGRGVFVSDCLVESVVDSCVHIVYYIIVYIANSLLICGLILAFLFG